MARRKSSQDGTAKTRHVRMTDDEWQRINEAARLQGVTASALIRRAALREASAIQRLMGEESGTTIKLMKHLRKGKTQQDKRSPK